jgi:hypothetical protein
MELQRFIYTLSEIDLMYPEDKLAVILSDNFEECLYYGIHSSIVYNSSKKIIGYITNNATICYFDIDLTNL